MVHAVTTLMAVLENNSENTVHNKKLLSRFVKKTINFMKMNDSELMQMKNSVTRNINDSEKAIEARMKQFQGQVDIQIATMKVKMDEMAETVDDKMKWISEEMSLMEHSDVLTARFMHVIEEKDEVTQEKIDQIRIL